MVEVFIEIEEKLYAITLIMVMTVFVRFSLNSYSLALDHVMALPSLIPALLSMMPLTDRKIVNLLLISLSCCIVAVLEISNIFKYSLILIQSPGHVYLALLLVNVILSLVGSLLPCLLLGYRTGSRLRTALMQALLMRSTQDLYLDHYQLLVSLGFCV